MRLCDCHGEPMYSEGDRRYTSGLKWRCAVTKRGYQRDRYDADPIHRLSKNLTNAAQKRRRTLERMKAQLAEGS